MGVVVLRRCIDILTIIINFPYSTCISSFFSSSIPTSLFIFEMFFRSCFCYFFTIYSKRYSKNIRDRSKKSRSHEYNYLIISIIKNVKRASMARVRESRDFHVRGTDDVRLTLPADSVYENGVIEVSLLYV